MMMEKAGHSADIYRDGIKIDNVPQLTFAPGSLKFEVATEKKIAPRVHVTMQFTAAWDNAVRAAKGFANAVMAHPGFRREYSKWRATLARRERKRWRRYQRQKRKQ